MTVFVAVRMMKNRSTSGLKISSERYLPAKPSSIQDWTSPGNKVRLVAYEICPVYDKAFVTEPEAACIVDGIFLPRNEADAAQWPLEHLKNVSRSNSVKSVAAVRSARSSEPLADGEFAVVWSANEEIYSVTNVGGSHSLYVTETDDFIAISNRSTCLLGLPAISDELDEETIRWKAFQGYAYGRSTAFKSIKKILNGSRVSITNDGIRIIEPSISSLVDRDLRDDFFSNPVDTVNAEIDRLSSYMSRSFHHSRLKDIDVALSGGKDSRVILGLTLHADLSGSIKAVWTRGALYSPEVLSAEDVCAVLEIEGHEVRRPALVSSSVVTAGTIIRSIAGHDGMLSLYDFCGVSPRKDFRFQGHELGLRAGRFINAKTDDIDSFVQTALKSWSNPAGVVRTPEHHYSAMEEFFREAHEDGADVEDLGDLYSVFERLPSWAAVMSLIDYCGGAISNPMLEGGVIRFAFSVPPRFRRTEAFHYLALRRTAPETLRIPFADQQWSPSLLQYLSEIGVHDVEPSPPPYRGHKQYPNEKSPYVNNIKLDLFVVLKPIVRDIIVANREYFDALIDVDAFLEKQEAATAPSFTYLYASLGIYSAALIREYGLAIFDREQQQSVIADLQERMDLVRSLTPGAAANALESQWNDIVVRHERAIAALARDLYARG